MTDEQTPAAGAVYVTPEMLSAAISTYNDAMDRRYGQRASMDGAIREALKLDNMRWPGNHPLSDEALGIVRNDADEIVFIDRPHVASPASSSSVVQGDAGGEGLNRECKSCGAFKPDRNAACTFCGHAPVYSPAGEGERGAVARATESLDDAARRLFAEQYPGRDYDALKDMVKIGWLRKAHDAILSLLSPAKAKEALERAKAYRNGAGVLNYTLLWSDYDQALAALAPAVQPAAGRVDVLASMRDHYQFALSGQWPGVKTPHYALAGLFKMAGDEIERLRLAAISAPAQASGEPVKQTMTVNLTDKEMAALEELIAKKDLDGPKIFRDSFKLYQAVEKGAASVTWHETGPLGLPQSYPAQPIRDLREVYQLFLEGDLYNDYDRASELLGKMRRAIAALSAPQAAPGEGG